MMQKVGGKVDQLVLKSGDFIEIVQQKPIDVHYLKCFVRFVLNVNIGTKRKTMPSTINRNCTMIVQLNHTGSAGSMEAAGVINIFKRSVETKKLR